MLVLVRCEVSRKVRVYVFRILYMLVLLELVLCGGR